MAKNDLLLYLVVGGAAAYYYFRMGGKAQLDSILGELKGGGSSQINTGQNVSGGNIPSAEGISNDVQSMLEKMGVHGSGQSVSKTRQVDTTGAAKQSQTHTQHSSTLFTRPTRLGNL